MAAVALLASSGDARVDDILRGLVERYESAFPRRIRGHYLFGSYADGSAVGISDVDMMILFKDTLPDAEREAAERLAEDCGTLSPVRLDLWFDGENGVERDVVRLRLGSLLIYGEDIRDRLVLPPLPAYTRTAMDIGGYFLTRILRGRDRLVWPAEYPDPAGPLYGYDTVRIPEWYPPGTERGIKELVTSAARAAGGLAALEAGAYSGSKSASIRAYRERVGGEWAPYLDALYANGKMRWGYFVPSAAPDRRLLRDLCRRTLAFERHFFTRYRAYLGVLGAGDDAASRAFAAERLAELAPSQD